MNNKESILLQMANEINSLRAQLREPKKPKEMNPWFETETISSNCEATTTAMCIKVAVVCNMEENDVARYITRYACPRWKAWMLD